MGNKQQIRRVAIVGGTHGNEFTGIYLIKKLERFPHQVQRSSFETVTLFANPKAFAQVKRYVDQDLNRCFLPQDLQNIEATSYEAKRARAICYQIGAESDKPVDVVLDLHSTTANMGQTLILANNHPFNLQLAAYLCAQNRQVRVFSWAQDHREDPSLKSLCDFGFSIEVGPVAQGILDANCFQKTEAMLYQILDYLEAYNQDGFSSADNILTLYQFLNTLDYPRDEQGEIKAMIHPELQSRDYQPLRPGDPLFLTFDGQTICYTGDAIVYPIFINEAAYYEKGIAMCLTEKKQIAIEG